MSGPLHAWDDGRLGTSWTEEDVPNSTLFRWMIFNGGAPNCIPCKGRIPRSFVQ
ncbi:hypothetical protein M9458_011361, partial [Cirrhinus mrigala]